MKICFDNLDLILGSQSPRRKQLLEEIGLKFRCISHPVDEVIPEGLTAIEAALYISELKAKAFPISLFQENSLLITADTVVSYSDQLLGKPSNTQDAFSMLRLLSGRCHEVISSVTLRSKHKMKSFYAVTKVYFRELTDEEIEYYISEYKPFDKAGAYGIQEWIGKIGISKIEGSYFNVMGLPMHHVYSELCTFEFD